MENAPNVSNDANVPAASPPINRRLAGPSKMKAKKVAHHHSSSAVGNISTGEYFAMSVTTVTIQGKRGTDNASEENSPSAPPKKYVRGVTRGNNSGMDASAHFRNNPLLPDPLPSMSEGPVRSPPSSRQSSNDMQMKSAKSHARRASQPNLDLSLKISESTSKISPEGGNDSGPEFDFKSNKSEAVAPAPKKSRRHTRTQSSTKYPIMSSGFERQEEERRPRGKMSSFIGRIAGAEPKAAKSANSSPSNHPQPSPDDPTTHPSPIVMRDALEANAQDVVATPGISRLVRKSRRVASEVELPFSELDLKS
jgi:hypothetical protein